MEHVITQLEDIDLDEEILITLESFSEYNICESEEIAVPDDLFENKYLEDSTQLFIWSQRRISQNFGLLMKQR